LKRLRVATPFSQARSASKATRVVSPHGDAPPGRQKSRRYEFFSFHDLRQPIPQKVEKSFLELPPIPGSSKTGSQDANRSTSKLRLPSENGRMPCFA
jgi:hypothetical protein